MLGEASAGVWGALIVVALLTSAISLALHWRSESPRKLQSRVLGLETDFEELINSVNRWTSRNAMRDARAKKGEQTELAAPQRGTPEYKTWLRRRVRGVPNP